MNACEDNKIPRPSSGYQVKRAFGKPVERTPLSGPEDSVIYFDPYKPKSEPFHSESRLDGIVFNSQNELSKKKKSQSIENDHSPATDKPIDRANWKAYKHSYPAIYRAIYNNEKITLREFLNAGNCENISYTKLSLSVRSTNCIQREFTASATIYDILDAPLVRVVCMRNAGIKSVQEIIQVISDYCQQHPLEQLVSAKENESLDSALPEIVRQFAIYADLIRDEQWDEIEGQLDSDEGLEVLLRIIDIAEVIGPDMVAATIDSPYVMQSLYPSLNVFVSKAEQMQANKDKLIALLKELPQERRALPVKPFVQSLSEEQLCNAICDENPSFAQLPSLARLFNDEAYGWLKRHVELIKGWDTERILHEAIVTLTDREKEMLLLRANGESLKSIGDAYKLTRERIRQIEALFSRKLLSNRNIRLLPNMIEAFQGGSHIVTTAEIDKRLADEYSRKLLGYILTNIYEFPYSKQSDAYILFCHKEEFETIQEFVENLPDQIGNDDLDALMAEAERSGMNPEIISLEFKACYSFRESINGWQRGRIKRLDMAESILRSFDPDGIHVSSATELSEFRKRMLSQFGAEIRSTNNDQALAHLISRVGLLRGRGTYVAMRPCPIPDELLQRIHDYIEDDRTTVYMFTAMYDAFREDLLACGVDNRYYLQGILKSLWGDVYSFSRDYLSQGERVVGMYELVDSFMQKAGGVVTMDELRTAFPGATNTVLGFALQQKSILSMFGKYLHVSNLQLTDNEIARLHGILNSLLADGEAHTSDELYQWATREGSAWLERLNIPYQHALFSVVMYLFGEEYAFARPWVAAKGTLGEERVRYWQTRRSRDSTDDAADESEDGQSPLSTDPAAQIAPEMVNRFNTILSEEFPDGLRLIGMRLRKFRASYEEHFHEQVELDDNKLIAQLKSVCDYREDRIFPRSGAQQNALLETISRDAFNTLSSGATCIYPRQLFVKYREALAADMAVYTADALWPLLQSFPGNQLRLVGGLICLPGKKPNTASDVFVLIAAAYEPVTYTQMQERLWYLPFDEVKYQLVREKSIVLVQQETYFYAPNFPISSRDLTALKRAMRRRVEDKGYIVASGLRQLLQENCPGTATDTAGWPDWGIRNVMAWLLREDFDFNGALVSAKGSRIDSVQVFRNFCKGRERVTMDELKDLQKQLDLTGAYWPIALEEMIRVSRTEFVKKGIITFDTEGTDQVLATFCPGRYRPIQEFSLFMLLPAVGIPWNSFLLESYLREYSKVFWLNQALVNEYAAVGAMVRRGSNIHDYRELIIDALAHDDGWSTIKDALGFLADKGYRSQRTLAHANEIIKAAQVKREQLHAAEK